MDRASDGEVPPAPQVTQVHGTRPQGASEVLILVPIIFFLVIAIGAGAVILALADVGGCRSWPG